VKIIHISYNVPRPNFSDPEAWLKRISFTTHVLQHMAAYASTVAIYNIRYKGFIEKNNVSYYFPKFSRWALRFPFRVNRFIKKLQPDVVIVHGLIFPWQVVMLRMQLGQAVKILAQHHAERPFWDVVRIFFQRWADRHIDAYLFTSHDLASDWLAKQQIRNASKVKEVMTASSSFYPMDKKIARQVTRAIGEHVFLWVGNLNENKDPETMVRAFTRFAQHQEGASLYMIFQSVELLRQLKKILSESATGNRVFLVGKVENDDLLHWYNSADFIVSSSHYESAGIAVCEALSCGCIPILTNIPSFRMMTQRGAMGVLFEPGDEDGLVSALAKGVTLNRTGEVEKVLKRFNEALSCDAIARRTMQIIREET
jgi:glycosyltransferase involved in cell wall biosynthesis